MNPDEVDQALLDQHFPFGLVHEELTHRDGDRSRFAHTREPADVFGREGILKEEETELLELLGKIDRQDRLNPLVDVMQQLELVTKLATKMLEEFGHDTDVGRLVPGLL